MEQLGKACDVHPYFCELPPYGGIQVCTGLLILRSLHQRAFVKLQKIPKRP